MKTNVRLSGTTSWQPMDINGFVQTSFGIDKICYEKAVLLGNMQGVYYNVGPGLADNIS